MITYKQLTLAEIFEDCQNKFDNDKYQFLSLLDEAINLDPDLASMTIFDTSGIEAWVTENNLKYANSCSLQSGNGI